MVATAQRARLTDATLVDEAVRVLLSEQGLALQGCWGGFISGDCTRCRPGFQVGTGHFKNKICPNCLSDGLLVPAERVRAVPAERTKDFVNVGSSGLWTVMGNGTEYRVINQTANCSGPRLIVFKDTAPDDQVWAPMPPGWVQAGNIKLSVMYGTLCPAVTRTRGVSSSVNTVAVPVEQARPGSIPMPAGFGGFDANFGGGFGGPGSFSSRAGGASSIASEEHEAAYEATYEHEPSSAPPSTQHSPQHSPQIVSSLDELIEAHARLSSMIEAHVGTIQAEADGPPVQSALKTLLAPLRSSAEALKRKRKLDELEAQEREAEGEISMAEFIGYATEGTADEAMFEDALASQPARPPPAPAFSFAAAAPPHAFAFPTTSPPGPPAAANGALEELQLEVGYPAGEDEWGGPIWRSATDSSTFAAEPSRPKLDKGAADQLSSLFGGMQLNGSAHLADTIGRIAAALKEQPASDATLEEARLAVAATLAAARVAALGAPSSISCPPASCADTTPSCPFVGRGDSCSSQLSWQD